ncbi:alpha/beta hydrolase [Solimonas terrae]|uniref:Alpha/beta hydrolase n=1 Tax=Solimonas terrae TaxID=1396819 RepID=A0A6M2BLR8_9GAMM|nr:alpha/beta hydrolase [Solimonas terrae]NGY03280.1 alpha/beta hydrolase [Solimonas terrae]
MKTIARLDGWKLRWLMNLTHLLSKLGLGGASAKAMKMPIERRAAVVPASWMLLPMPEVGIERSTLPARGGAIPLKRFLPRARKPSAVPILFIHGGGWIAGGVDSLDYLCTHLCDRLGTEVTAVGYRLAPEHPFPAGLEDCEDALDALLARSPCVDVVGDSAGGNLTAALSLRRRGLGVIRRQVLIYAFLDLTMASPSIDPPRQGMSRRDATVIIEKYRGAAAIDDPFVSPLLAPDLDGLPPAIIVTADADPLRDDGFRYADRLREAGIPVRLENYRGMPHAFLSLASLCSAAPLCIDMLVGELQA